MIPDIDHYAPLIEAVFGQPGLPLALPYSIADRQGQEEAPLLAWFERLLALPASRFERSTVMARLAQPQCQRAFGLALEDLVSLNDGSRLRRCVGAGTGGIGPPRG